MMPSVQRRARPGPIFWPAADRLVRHRGTMDQPPVAASAARGASWPMKRAALTLDSLCVIRRASQLIGSVTGTAEGIGKGKGNASEIETEIVTSVTASVSGNVAVRTISID